MTDSDAALVARIVANEDRAAFELLIQRHQSPVRNFLRRLSRNDVARADDLAQETFLRLFRSIKSFRGQSKFSSWLYRIAYNAFLDDLKTRTSEGPFDESQHSPMLDTSGAAGDEADVEMALRRLSDRQRAIFDLHYRKGMTHTEIAAALDIPLGTVKSDIVRGLEQLRQILVNTENL
jgi:RNA polymerase sigma factor (sigma-70 family)